MKTDILHRLNENLRMIFTDTVVGDGIDLNDLGNLAMYRFAEKLAFANKPDMKKLTEDEKKKLQEFWKPYFRHMPERYYERYKALNAPFDPRYIPEDIMFMYVDRHFSDREAAKYEDDKCQYYRLFKGINMPEALGLCIGGKWYDADYQEIGRQRAMELMKQEDEVVAKMATASECGTGVSFYKREEINEELMKKLESSPVDMVVQSLIRQHSTINSLHASSVNCLRIDSLLLNGESKICAVVLKIGQKGCRVDNTHHGGIYVGVDMNGHLMDCLYTGDNKPLDRIPDFEGDFRGLEIPGFASAIELVKKAHPMVPKYGFIGWDVAIDENGEAVLVEPNFSISGVFEDQLCCGPLFGDDSEEVLKRVFPKQRFSIFF